jgi:dihydrofolate reductase
MLISLIAAMDRRGLIGDETGMPWHLPADLRRFREYTWGKPIIMGRRTFELIGKPLPGRFSIVLSHDPEYSPSGCRVARTLVDALGVAEDYLATTGGDESMVIGGAQVYAQAIERWDRFYLTLVEGQFTGDTYFPVAQLLRQNWRLAGEPQTHAADERNRHPHTFFVLERIRAEKNAAGANATVGPEGLDLAAILRSATTGG